MGNAETRPFRVSRFGRRNTGSGSASPGGANIQVDMGPGAPGNDGSGSATPAPAGLEPGPRTSSGRGLLLAGPPNANRRSRMEDLEDMMFMEAIRLSLAAEEERKRKAEKEERKQAKKREKEERKAAKAAAKHGPYGSSEARSGQSSASGSNLSLPGLAFGRKRGNSGASNLRVEASVASAMASTSGPGSPVSDPSVKDKGKAVERSLPSTPEVSQDGSEDGVDDPLMASVSTISAATSTPRAIPSPHQPAGPSHLRQMSSASSVTSSPPDSYSLPSHLHDPRASAISLGSRSGASEDGGDQDRDKDPSASTEPMFNFRSLAEVVGVSLEGEHAGRRLSRIEADKIARETAGATGQGHTKADEVQGDPMVERVENAAEDDDAFQLPTSGPVRHGNEGISYLAPPEVTITPDTPAPADDDNDESKQLGYQGATVEQLHQVTQ